MKQLTTTFFFLILVFHCVAQWKPCGIGTNGINTWGTSVCVHQGKVYATNNSKGLQVSADNGATWTQVNSQMTTTSNMYSTGNRLYVILTEHGCSQIMYSTDNGQTFLYDSVALPHCSVIPAFTPSSSGCSWKDHMVLSVSGPDWEFAKSDQDTAWTDASYFDPNDPADFYSRNDTVWASTHGSTSNGVAWSVDGINWTSPKSTGIPSFYLGNQIALTNNKIYLSGWDYAIGGDSTLYVSSDHAASFQKIDLGRILQTSGFYWHQNIVQLFAYDQTLYMMLENNMDNSSPDLLVSTDEGKSFSFDTLGLPSGIPGIGSLITHMAYLNGWVYAQVNAGDLYRKQVGTTSGLSAQLDQPFFSIHPNPTHDQLSIQLQNKGNHMLRIYDLTGKVIYNKMLHASSNSIELTDICTGIYIVEVSNEQGSHQLKLVKN